MTDGTAWRCPTCHYLNRSWYDGRCLRCRAPLLMPLACSGQCRGCLLAAPGGSCVAPPKAQEDPAP